MSTLFDGSTASAALWMAIKASALFAIAAAIDLPLRRRASAATRHLLWTITLSGVLLLPPISLIVPEWAVPVRRAQAPVAAESIVVDPATASSVSSTPLVIDTETLPESAPASRFAWPAVVAVLYVTGAIVMLALLVVQQATVRRFGRRARIVDDAEWARLVRECARLMDVRRRVRLLRSVEHNVPLTYGTRTPSIVIPAVAEEWSIDRRRAVLLHELAHVARFDCLAQAVATVACAAYWFHPAAWWAARRLRVERELACDDLVIAAGTEPRDYAGHLLEIAYTFGRHRAPALAVTMARRQQLEGRLLAALDAARNRRVPALRARVVGVAIAAVLLAVVAAVRLTTAVASADDASSSMIAAAGIPHDSGLSPHVEKAKLAIRQVARHIVRSTATAFGPFQSAQPGTWEIRPTGKEGMVNLRLAEGNSSWGSTVAIDRLEGFTGMKIAGVNGPVQFRLKRDAGTFTFDGVLRDGIGAGTFTFAPDPSFPAELVKRGFARPTPDEQYDLAKADTGFAFLDELNAQKYTRPQTSELVRAGQHGVGTTYLHEMGAIGYRVGSLASLITLRDHGVTPSYARELADQGYKGLSVEELQKARDHGVSAEYARAMREAHGSLSLDALINARDHGVSPEFAKALADAGYRNLTLDALLKARDHGVSEEYVREMKQLGFTLSLDDLVRARDHGVGVEFIRELASLGYSGLTMDALTRLRDHGVSPQYARELKALGYDKVALDELIKLRDHGVTAERIRSANARAGTRLPIDLLTSLADGGWR